MFNDGWLCSSERLLSEFKLHISHFLYFFFHVSRVSFAISFFPVFTFLNFWIISLIFEILFLMLFLCYIHILYCSSFFDIFNLIFKIFSYLNFFFAQFLTLFLKNFGLLKIFEALCVCYLYCFISCFYFSLLLSHFWIFTNLFNFNRSLFFFHCHKFTPESEIWWFVCSSLMMWRSRSLISILIINSQIKQVRLLSCLAQCEVHGEEN